jgi:hypothetical protein
MRARWNRLIAGAVVVGATALASGCVVFQSGPDFSQLQTIGDVQLTLTACASNTTTCANKGFSDATAQPGPSQALVALQVPESVTPLPASFTSTGPEALAFAESASYESELQRLAPAAAGRRWVGYITPTAFNYSDTSGPQTFAVQLPIKLPQGPDGSPFPGPLSSTVLVGSRGVSASFPATRPVACGTALTTAFDEDPRATPNDVFVICEDALSAGALITRDLGVLAANATASGGPGSLVSLPFTLRYAGNATAAANFALTATSTLPGATLAVTPGGLAPASNSDSQALVAVGIPAGARAGTYDVTLTAKLANGQTRSRTGKLTVTGAGGGGGATGGGATVKLKLTTLLPRGLSAETARKSGIAVLIGATKKITARVKLFQGTGRRNRRPKASKSVRLRVPGPVQVILRSQRLHAGPYRVVIRADGRNFVRRARLTQ